MDLGKEFCRSTEQEPFIVDKGTLILGVDVVLEDWGGMHHAVQQSTEAVL